MNLSIQKIQSSIIKLPSRPPFMLTRDLADIYETVPDQITQAVRRHPERFPEDFCFDLSGDEILRLQNEGILTKQHLNRRLLGFTRLGANMLSAVLKSPEAAARSVQIMRAFSAMEETGQVPAAADPQALALALSLASQVGKLTDMVRARDEIIHAHEQRYTKLQGRMIGTQRGHIVSLKEIARMQKRAEALEIRRTIIYMKARGDANAEIMRVTGKDLNYIRQRVFIARRDGALPKKGGAA